ncbi:MAG TPA: omptin family outer membrane protease [Gammaproteobacteria bacterium]
MMFISQYATAKNYTTHHATQHTTHNETMEIRLNGGYLTGQSGEYVYDADGAVTGIAGYKMSQLDWKIDTAYLVGVGASLKLGRRTRFNLDYWQNAADGEATMDDYDWFYVGADWSDWSHHENTTATEISNVDINGEFTFLKFDNEQASITGIVGYRQDHLKWVAVGGTAIYSIDSYRDSKVIFPETKGITYEQNFKTPYIGLGLHSAGESNELPIVLNASVQYSGWAQGDDSDTHHLRNLLFEESGDGGKWLGMNVSLEFFLSQVMSLNVAYAYQRYQEIKASTTMTDLTTGDVTYFGGASAGLEHSSRRTSVQFSYHF